MNIFTELQKRGYQITNKRVLELPEQIKLNPENKRKKLIQELALVVDWIRIKYKLVITIDFDELKDIIELYRYHINEIWTEGKDYFDYKYDFKYINGERGFSYQEATIAAIEYLIENKLI